MSVRPSVCPSVHPSLREGVKIQPDHIGGGGRLLYLLLTGDTKFSILTVSDLGKTHIKEAFFSG